MEGVAGCLHLFLSKFLTGPYKILPLTSVIQVSPLASGSLVSMYEERLKQFLSFHDLKFKIRMGERGHLHVPM